MASAESSDGPADLAPNRVEVAAVPSVRPTRGPAEKEGPASSEKSASTLSGRFEKIRTFALPSRKIERSSASLFGSASRIPKSSPSPWAIPQNVTQSARELRISGKCGAKSGSWKIVREPSATEAPGCSKESGNRSPGFRSGKTNVPMGRGFPPSGDETDTESISPSKKLTMTRSLAVRTVTVSPSRR